MQGSGTPSSLHGVTAALPLVTFLGSVRGWIARNTAGVMAWPAILAFRATQTNIGRLGNSAQRGLMAVMADGARDGQEDREEPTLVLDGESHDDQRPTN